MRNQRKQKIFVVTKFIVNWLTRLLGAIRRKDTQLQKHLLLGSVADWASSNVTESDQSQLNLFIKRIVLMYWKTGAI